MALAIRFEQLIQAGEITDYAELARLGHVTRARITQIMNLRLLAPDLQNASSSSPILWAGASQFFSVNSSRSLPYRTGDTNDDFALDSLLDPHNGEFHGLAYFIQP